MTIQIRKVPKSRYISIRKHPIESVIVIMSLEDYNVLISQQK